MSQTIIGFAAFSFLEILFNFVIPLGAKCKPNILYDADEEEISPYATVHISSIFPLNAENNAPSNNDTPLETLPFQLRTPQEERDSGRAESQSSAYKNTDHLGRPSVTPVEYLFYQPRYTNEAVDTTTSKLVIRPGYDTLSPATRTKRPCEYDSLIRETDLKCKSRGGDITDHVEDNMNIHTILEEPSSNERSLTCSMDKKKNQENSLGEIESERTENVWKKGTVV